MKPENKPNKPIDVQKIIQQAVDLILEESKEKRSEMEKNKIIPSDLTRKLSEAKGMRNILAHEYGKINVQLVYEAVHDELTSDVGEFLNQIERLIAEDDNDATTP